MRDGKFRMVVFGDSVNWGQGLAESDKFYSLVAQGLAERDGGPLPEIKVLAHSAAIIGAHVTTNQGALDPEVPTPYPTIMQQVNGFTDAPETVDLVLLNGGINDVDIRDLLNPLTDAASLRDWIEAHCHADMRTLLDNVTGKFTLPTARIVVTGYYLVLSEKSDPKCFEPLLNAIGAPWLDYMGDEFLKLGIDNVVKNCAIFYQDSTAALQNAVEDANATAGGRIKFVDPGFGPENSAFAEPAWVFGVDGVDFSPQDEVIASRHVACDNCQPNLALRWICYRASAGHPNALGAKQYAKQILANL